MFVHDRAKLCKRTLTAVMPGIPRPIQAPSGLPRFVRNGVNLPKSAEAQKKRKFRAIPRAFSPPLKPNINALGAVSLLSVCNGDER